MSATLDQIVSDALGLPPHARAFIAEKLIESLDASVGDELSPKWRDEIRRRCKEMDDGLVVLRNAEDVFTKAREALG